jgi:integration host factor subunit beta
MSEVNRHEVLSETTEPKCALLTKRDLVENVATVVEVSRKEAAEIVERILDSIVRTLHRGDRVEIRGFGTFRTRQRAPRSGRNPKTGVRIEVPAKRIPFFKPGKELRDLLEKP